MLSALRREMQYLVVPFMLQAEFPKRQLCNLVHRVCMFCGNVLGESNLNTIQQIGIK